MTRTVLVTGAGGFVGSHLAQGLAALGDAVTGVDVAFDAAARHRLGGCVLIEAELESGLSDLDRFDVVIHGAAITTEPVALGLTDAEHLQANIDLFLASLDFATTRGAGTFVFLSSSGVFEGTAAELLLESTPTCSTSPYGLAKRAGELLLGLATARGVRAIAVRLGPIYGHHEQQRPTRTRVSLPRQWFDAAAAGKPIIVRSPTSRRDWTYASDLAPAIHALLADDEVDGVVHLCGPEVVTDLDLAWRVATLAGGAVLIEPDTLPLRRPMASERLANLIPWTPLSTGLGSMLVEAP